MRNDEIIPVILSGGKGTRLWPLSRSKFPKQYISIGNEKKTLLQKTYERVLKYKNIFDPILICNEENRFVAAEQIREINSKSATIILEPFGRGTAPAIVIATLKALESKTNPLLLVLSSDHDISDDEKFLNAVCFGINYAKQGRIVTFGIEPNKPSTGYGYIKSEKPVKNDLLQASNIEAFIEKPNSEKAKEFLEDKCFSWNSGIFLFKANVLISEIKKFHPEILINCRKALQKKSIDFDFQRLCAKSFEKCPNLSIDVAIMERTKLGTVVPLCSNWRDLGSWQDVWESSNKDQNGNVIQGSVVLKNGTNNFLKSENKLIVAVGIDNLIIVETLDATLILNKKYCQKLKEVVEFLNEKNQLEAKEHKRILRPWGNYTTISEEKNWKVKKIIINPHQSLSLQLHKYRSEHWVVLKGIATTQINNRKIKIFKNQSIFIPLGTKHRLINEENDVLIIMEVQVGEYVLEDDILRFEDDYGRIIKKQNDL